MKPRVKGEAPVGKEGSAPTPLRLRDMDLWLTLLVFKHLIENESLIK